MLPPNETQAHHPTVIKFLNTINKMATQIADLSAIVKLLSQRIDYLENLHDQQK